MINKKAKQLFKRFRKNKHSDQEHEILKRWVDQLNSDDESELTEEDIDRTSDKIWASLDKKVNPRPFRLVYLPRLAAAAVLLVAVSVGLLLMQKTPVVQQKQARIPISPGGNNAVLTLSNGQKVNLNQAANGQISSENGTMIKKVGAGKVAYVGNSGANGENLYNTIEIPVSGQYQVALPDGSNVWLNAASKLKFPVAFNGKERKVELEGEGYFEVKHDASRPFRVVTNAQVVEVLGTHFDISSYADEAATKTTLLQGSVRVTPLGQPGRSAIIKPGEQAVLKDKTVNVLPADLDVAIAWKNGMFRFDEEELSSVMLKISRWYNVKVVFSDEAVKRKHFSAIITRYSQVTELLKLLELTEKVHFKIDQKTITVTN